ncbi:MAG: YkgJ family cysteine cluster protein [Desulfobulbaceae bacterium]|nr:YkgJ family cysteine cluster protein [Desulfobulbaceae bacterium]
MTDRDHIGTDQGQALQGRDTFSFRCHPKVPCYLVCCSNVRLLLYPYDVLRLKQCLHLHSGEFLSRYVEICEGSHPFFPGLKLRLKEQEGYPCPFLEKHGCGVYKDRPSACRTYPLERGVAKESKHAALTSQYFLTHHPWCKGHDEVYHYTLRQWEREQELHDWNLHNDYWAELDAFFASNPWAGEGKAGPMQQLAFMVCYNLDAFRIYAGQNRLVEQFRLTKIERRAIQNNDADLLVFGFKWLEYVLGGRKQLVAR